LKGQSIILLNSIKESIFSLNNTGISLGKAVAMNNNILNNLRDLTPSGTISSGTTKTNTLTTAGAGLIIKGDPVLF
jgi:hypothetical protein